MDDEKQAKLTDLILQALVRKKSTGYCTALRADGGQCNNRGTYDGFCVQHVPGEKRPYDPEIYAQRSERLAKLLELHAPPPIIANECELVLKAYYGRGPYWPRSDIKR